jgi:hypothetical protein
MTDPASSRLLVTPFGYGILSLTYRHLSIGGSPPVRGLCMVIRDRDTGRTCADSATYRADIVSKPGGLMPVPTNLCPAHTADLRRLGVVTQASTGP